MSEPGWIAVGAAAWIACGVIDYGFCVAYFQREFPTLADRDRTSDRLRGLLCIPFGLGSLLATMSLGHDRHGWML